MKTLICLGFSALITTTSFAQSLSIELDVPSIQSHQGNFKASGGGNMTHWKTFALDYAQSQKISNQQYADNQRVLNSNSGANANTASINSGAGSINIIIQENHGTNIAVAEGK